MEQTLTPKSAKAIAAVAAIENIYCLKYRENYSILEKYFFEPLGFQTAIQKGKDFCNASPRRRFVIVRPFLDSIEVHEDEPEVRELGIVEPKDS